MNITLHIEHLVLEDIALTHTERAKLKAAVEAELARLIAEQGLPARLREGARGALHGQHVMLEDTTDPATLGQQIARSVYGVVER